MNSRSRITGAATVVAAIFLGFGQLQAATVVEISDGTFDPADWQTTILLQEGGADHTHEQQLTGGNPDAYRFMEHELPGPSRISVFHQYLAQTYDPSTDLAILSLDYSEDQIQFNPPFFGAAIGARPALLQDGIVYSGPALTYTTTAWTTASLLGLTANDFLTGGEVPDFSASRSPIHFGFIRSNSNTSASSYSTEHGIDNWSFSVTPVPEPSSLTLLAIGAAGLWRRRVRQTPFSR